MPNRCNTLDGQSALIWTVMVGNLRRIVNPPVEDAMPLLMRRCCSVGQPILANAAYFFHEPAPPWTDSVGIHHCLEFTLRPYGGRNRGLGRCPGSILTWVKRFRMCWLKYLPLDSAFSNS